MLSSLMPKGLKINPNKKGREFNSIFCSYESLFDIDFGCILYILSKYQTSKYIKPEVINYTPFFLQFQLVHRTNINPLSILFKDEYIDQIDNLYNELLTDKIDEVSRLAFPTYLITLINTMKDMTGYSLSVECNSDIRKEKVENFKLFPIEYQENLDDYFTLILKTPSDLKSRIGFSGKTIYLWNTTVNYYQMKKGVENEMLNDDIIALMGMKNVITMSDPYQFTEELVD